MNKKLMNTAAASITIGSYESPKTEVLEIRSEGVLCQSGAIEEWEEEQLPW